MMRQKKVIRNDSGAIRGKVVSSTDTPPPEQSSDVPIVKDGIIIW